MHLPTLIVVLRRPSAYIQSLFPPKIAIPICICGCCCFAIAFVVRQLKRSKAGAEQKKQEKAQAKTDKVAAVALATQRAAADEEIIANDFVAAEQAAAALAARLQQAAFDRDANAQEAYRATQRSTFHGARAFIGSPTVMTPIVEIQLALIQLEAACAFEEGATAPVRAARCEWRKNVCGVATLALGGTAPITVVGVAAVVAAEVANPLGFVRTGAVYSSDVSGGQEPTFAPMRTGAVYSSDVSGGREPTFAPSIDHTWDGARQPSAPPAPTSSDGLLCAPRDSLLNDSAFASLAAAHSDAPLHGYRESNLNCLDTVDVYGHNKNTNTSAMGAQHRMTELTQMQPMQAPVTTAATGYCAVSVAELRTQLLKLEVAMAVESQVCVWSENSHCLRKKWCRYVASEDVDRGVGEDKLVSRLASGLLMLDRSLEERVSIARKQELVWREQIVNQGDVVCVWAARQAWRQRLEGLGGNSHALEWDAGVTPLRSTPALRSGGGGTKISRNIALVCRSCDLVGGRTADKCAVCSEWVTTFFLPLHSMRIRLTKLNFDCSPSYYIWFKVGHQYVSLQRDR